MRKLFVLFSIILSGCSPASNKYKVGDCFSTPVNMYKIVKVGRYGVVVHAWDVSKEKYYNATYYWTLNNLDHVANPIDCPDQMIR